MQHSFLNSNKSTQYSCQLICFCSRRHQKASHWCTCMRRGWTNVQREIRVPGSSRLQCQCDQRNRLQWYLYRVERMKGTVMSGSCCIGNNWLTIQSWLISIHRRRVLLQILRLCFILVEACLLFWMICQHLYVEVDAIKASSATACSCLISLYND